MIWRRGRAASRRQRPSARRRTVCLHEGRRRNGADSGSAAGRQRRHRCKLTRQVVLHHDGEWNDIGCEWNNRNASSSVDALPLAINRVDGPCTLTRPTSILLLVHFSGRPIFGYPCTQPTSLHPDTGAFPGQSLEASDTSPGRITTTSRAPVFFPRASGAMSIPRIVQAEIHIPATC